MKKINNTNTNANTTAMDAILNPLAADRIKITDASTINAFSTEAIEAFTKHVERIAKEYADKINAFNSTMEQKVAMESELDKLGSLCDETEKRLDEETMDEFKEMYELKLRSFRAKYIDLEKKVDAINSKLQEMEDNFINNKQEEVEDDDLTMEDYEDYMDNAANTTASIQRKEFDFHSDSCKFTLSSDQRYYAIVDGKKLVIKMSGGARDAVESIISKSEDALDKATFTVSGANNSDGSVFIGFARKNDEPMTEEEKKAKAAEKAKKEAKRAEKREKDRQFTAQQKLGGGKKSK